MIQKQLIEKDIDIQLEDINERKNSKVKQTHMYKRISETNFHKMDFEELKTILFTDFSLGLSFTQVEQLRILFGENRISRQSVDSIWMEIIRWQRHRYAIFFWVCAIICFIVYGIDTHETSNLLIGLFIIITILITSFLILKQDRLSNSLIASSQKLSAKCKVRRDNNDIDVDITHLVVGDIIYITSPMKIPADIRVIEANQLIVNNYSLTGENNNLIIDVECNSDNYYESRNMMFSGTEAVDGQGKGVVVNIGNYTLSASLFQLSTQQQQQSLDANWNMLLSIVDRFLVTAFLIGVVFFLLAYLAMQLSVLCSITIGVCIAIAQIPVSLLVSYKVSITLVIQNLLLKKNVLIQNRNVIKQMGNISCIYADKTGTITQNKMTVYHLWYNDTIYRNKDIITLENDNAIEYDATTSTFKDLQKCALMCCDARFTLSNQQDKKNIDYVNCPIIGDASESGLLRFFQQIEDIEEFRNAFKVASNQNDSQAKIPFTASHKMNLIIIEEQTENSYYTVFIKGAPERIKQYCSTVNVNNQKVPLDQTWDNKLSSIISQFGDNGERIFGFAMLHLSEEQFPRGTTFQLSSMNSIPFDNKLFSFCGMISLNDPPRKEVPEAIRFNNSLGIKTIMITGDHYTIATNIARKVNIIPQNKKTNIEMSQNQINIDDQYLKKENIPLVICGNDINHGYGMNDNDLYLNLIKKGYTIYSRMNPYQKLKIMESYQMNGQVVAAIGDGINDAPMIKKSDVGISINNSNSLLFEASDIVLLDNNLGSIISIIEEGRKFDDNIRKSMNYILSSNMTEIVSFLAFVIIQIPLPLSSLQILAICFITDILPAISFAYEQPEIDALTRNYSSKYKPLINLKTLFTSLLQIGFISCAAGFSGYFTTFNYFGFPVQSLFGLAKIQGYKPLLNDFNPHFNPDINHHDSFFNENLFKIAPDCRLNTQESNKLKYDIDWFDLKQGHFDLRKALIKCDSNTGRWVSNQVWSECDIQSSMNTSPVTNQTVCYSTDAMRYAQSSFFVCILFIQWAKLIVFKTRSMQFFTQVPNKLQVVTVLFELVIIIILLYAPQIQDVLGGRPIHFWMFGFPSIPFCFFIIIFEECRKYFIQKYSWFIKFTKW